MSDCHSYNSGYTCLYRGEGWEMDFPYYSERHTLNVGDIIEYSGDYFSSGLGSPGGYSGWTLDTFTGIKSTLEFDSRNGGSPTLAEAVTIVPYTRNVTAYVYVPCRED
jgi:hypothetical protein